MSLMRQYIAELTPKMNPLIAEGFSYHRLEEALEYLDASIRDSCDNNEVTGLKYLGARFLTPEEEIYESFTKTKQRPYDMAYNSMRMAEFLFQYGNEAEPRRSIMYIPFCELGNKMYINDKAHTIMPVLSDKVISIGDKDIFINVFTGKFNFSRLPYTALEDGNLRNATVVTTMIYKNAVTLGPSITNAHHTVIHYLLAYHGYEETMKMILGFVPTPTYDASPSDEYTIIESTGAQPSGWVMNAADIAFGVFDEGKANSESESEGKVRRSNQRKDARYRPNNIKFLVPKELNNQHVFYTLVNVLYVLDNFPLRVSINELNNTTVWRRFLGEIIFANEKTLATIMRSVNYHLDSNEIKFNAPVISNLKDLGIKSKTLKELLSVIFNNFNNWVSTGGELSLVDSKSLEVETFVLSRITAGFNRLLMDLNKEEMRNDGQLLDEKTVSTQFKNNIRLGTAFGIRSFLMHVAKFEDTTDHLIFKQTAFLAMQESDFVNLKGPSTNTSGRMKMTAEMAIIGSVLNLSKKKPTPLIRINVYMQVDFLTGNITIPDHLKEIVKNTNIALSQPFIGVATQNDEGSVEFDEEYEDIEDEVNDFDEDDSVE